jgi:tetratricopeptide (TPR) repeat protein
MMMGHQGIEAEQSFRERISRTEELRDEGLKSAILATRAETLAEYGYLDEGNQMLAKAEEIANGVGNLKYMLLVLFLRPFTERWLGHPGKAVELTEGMPEMMLQTFSVINFIYIVSIRGMALAEIGRIEEGMDILNQAIDLCEKSGNMVRLGALYNTLGYCYSEIHQPQRAWEFNLKAEEIARRLWVSDFDGRRQYGAIIAQSCVNLMENLFDQGKSELIWRRSESLKEETKSKDFDMDRLQYESRMNYLAAQILLLRSDLSEAENIIQKNLEMVQKKLMKKREGCFLRLLGELQIRRNDNENGINKLYQAITILKEVGNPRQLWQAHASLALSFRKTGRSSEARQQWGAAAEVIHKTAKGLSDRNLREGLLNANPIRDILAKAGS